jgi:hypothetical protein
MNKRLGIIAIAIGLLQAFGFYFSGYEAGKHGADRWYGESIDDKYAKPICQVETKPDFTWIDDMLKERKGKNK